MTAELPPDVAIEAVWLLECPYAPDATETRAPHRAEHLRRVLALREAGIVIEAGALADVSRSVLLVRAADEQAALDIARSDVYMREGVWVEVRAGRFGRAVRPSELAPGT
jgi:hypothetical protein